MSWLRRLNTHGTFYTGMGLGAVSLVALGTDVVRSAQNFVAVISDPTEIGALYTAEVTHHDPGGAVVAVVGPFIGLIGSFGVFVLAIAIAGFLAGYGRPTTIPADTNGSNLH